MHFKNWLLENFVNDHSTHCEDCQSPLLAQKISINPGHMYEIGQHRICKCRKSRIWTNAIKNPRNLIDLFDGKKAKYTDGFYNEKFCGYCFSYLYPFRNNWGCKKCQQNQAILMNLNAENAEDKLSSIIAWYRKHLAELKRVV